MIKIRISYDNDHDAGRIVETLQEVLDITARPRTSFQGEHKKLYIDAVLKKDIDKDVRNAL